MRTASLTREKKGDYYLSKVTPSPTLPQRPGNQAHNFKMVYWIQFPGELSSPAWLPFFVWGNQHASLNVKWKSRQSNISMLMLILGLKRSARIWSFFRYGFVTFHNEESVRQVTDMVIWIEVFSYFQIIVPHSSTHASQFQFVLDLLTSFPYYLKALSLTKINFSSYRNQIRKVSLNYMPCF